MAPISPGQMSGPPRKSKKPTATTKAHRFEGFTKRIAKIKIDPIHSVQKSRISDEHNDDFVNSHFRSALDEWAELNLTATFTSFLNKAQPLSESLPQLLHHADTIFSLLLEHIQRQESLALEPLLSLVAHLAHDLGQSFQKYFQPTVKLVTQVSASIDDPESIERCFTCLAWMFKYLSKTLLKDLRPLLGILVPYFSSRKEYVRRFTAESLAFLLRKAAILYSKNALPLQNAITHLLDQLAEKDGTELELFQNALMTLLSESAIGVDDQLHSSAVDLFRCIFELVVKVDDHVEHSMAVLDGVVVNLVHRTDAVGFAPLLYLIVEVASKSHQCDSNHRRMVTHLLLDVTTTRKGSRISEWNAVIQALLVQLESEPKFSTSIPTLLQPLSIVSAAVVQYCPMDQLLPFANRIVESITPKASPYQFFAFCDLVADLGKQRFQDLVLPHLQKYIISHWSIAENETCYILQKLSKSDAISNQKGDSSYVFCPSDWENSIARHLREFSDPAVISPDFFKYTRLHKALHFPRDDTVMKDLCLNLESAIKPVFMQPKTSLELSTRLSLGWAFEFYLYLLRCTSQEQPKELLRLMFSCRPEYFQLVPFLRCCLEVLSQAESKSLKGQNYETTIVGLCDNMLSDSLELRKYSIELLFAIGRDESNQWLTDTCSLLLELIQIPYVPSNARQIAMLLRRLPKQQESCGESPILQKLVPFFGLGQLRLYHDSTRKDLCIALNRMATSGKAEDIILDVAIQWLHKSGDIEQPRGQSSHNEGHAKLSPFQCSNHQAIQKLTNNLLDQHSTAEVQLKHEFEEAHSLRPATIPIESRILALQILLEIPGIAERRSRALSPVFLSIQQSTANHHVPYSDESASSHTVSPDYNDQPWTLVERKLFLELLGKFINPRVLYRSHELHDHLLELLTNGNSDVRKLALLALLRWKDQSLSQYSETMIRVAEDKNGTSELALLLASDEEDGSVKTFDRQNILPILLRLVFGQLVGRVGTHGSQEVKRKGILRLLFRMKEDEVNKFLAIALGRLGEVSLHNQAVLNNQVLDRDIISQDQQYGFLRMMITMQEVLQSQYEPYGKKVIDAILYCTARACREAHHSPLDEISAGSTSALAKNIRRSGIQCLTTTFEICEDIDWKYYIDIIFDDIINPRVPNLAMELTQGVSGLLRIFSTWAQSQKLVHLLKYNNRLSENIWKILAVSSARDDVKVYILDHILTPILGIAGDSDINPNPATTILNADIELILQSVVSLLGRQPAKDLLLAVIKTIQPLAPFAFSSESANEVLNLLITLLCEPAQRIPPHIKGQLLSATESLLKLGQNKITALSKTRLYNTIADLFNYFKDQPNRLILSDLLATLAENELRLQQAVQLCRNLNAVSSKHLGEVDYEKQLSAYNTINVLSVADGAPEQWPPILNNVIYYARTADDFAIRSNAVSCLKSYIIKACQSQNDEAHGFVRNILLPAFKRGVREDSELVRADFVFMYGLVVKHLSNAPDLEDLKVLLVGDDEEASFFSNVLHIQQHRRMRAIRRLVAEVERGHITSANVSGLFLPLLEKFIDDDSPDESAQSVKGQSITAMSTLLQWIDWKSFRTIFRQYRSNLDSPTRSEKDSIRLLNNASDALTVATKTPAARIEENNIQSHLSATLPQMETLGVELKSNFIPRLSRFIHHKNEAEISLRIPAAKVAVKLIKILPADEVSLLVTPIILDISQILRSRAQESRDIARNTLAEIIVLLGPSSMQFALKEMRTTLTRGYQLHVLSYTLHTILLQSVKHCNPGDLDYCLEDLMAVIMDDIFGVVGQEKENQDYISSMKEVKSSKSQDSLEILAKLASVKHMSKLIQPFQALLVGKLTTRQVHQVDELFRRIGVGILHNPVASSRELLLFAYELIQAFYRQKSEKQERVMTNDEKNRQRYLIQMKSAGELTSSTSTSLLYKIVRFALDIVRSTLAKHTSLLTVENVHGYLPIIGDCLVEAQDDVRISAFRLLSTIIKLPLTQLDENATMYVIEAVKVVKGSVSTSEESSQGALKFVAALLRERRDVKVRDSDIAYLLHRTMPDIEEPDRQGVTFNFIKAVMARNYQLPEVYELMDKIGVMMVTNQTRAARDVARGVFVHFLLEYPQSKNRWSKQIRFFVKNLEYEHKEGRQSIMEAIHVLLQKLDSDTVQEVASTFFIPIVLRMSNDDNSAAREMAGALLEQVFRVVGRSEIANCLDPLRNWLEQSENVALAKVSMQAWGIYFDVVSQGVETDIENVRNAIAKFLKGSEPSNDDWELKYQALELLFKLVFLYPEKFTTQAQAGIWTTVVSLMLSEHVWIQISVANLLDKLYENYSNDHDSFSLPMTSTHGLRFDQHVVLDQLRNSLRTLKRNEGNLDLARTTLNNILFLGRFVEATEIMFEIKDKSKNNGMVDHRDSANELDEVSEDDADAPEYATKSIPATQYLLDQLSGILRREPSKLTTSAFTPRISAISILNNLIPQLSSDSLPESAMISLLVPLNHITDPSLQRPRSADQTFSDTYQSYTESASMLQETIQRKVGDSTYVKLITTVAKIVRERRGERKMKRAIDRVANPERAEREKKRRKDINARRNKVVVDIHRKKRRGDLGF